jgi:hypothetical protein
MVLGAVVALTCAVATPAQAKTNQFTLFEAPRELLSSDDTLRAQTLDEIQGLGVHWLRVVLYWRSVDPSAQSATPPSFN